MMICYELMHSWQSTTGIRYDFILYGVWIMDFGVAIRLHQELDTPLEILEYHVNCT